MLISRCLSCATQRFHISVYTTSCATPLSYDEQSVSRTFHHRTNIERMKLWCIACRKISREPHDVNTVTPNSSPSTRPPGRGNKARSGMPSGAFNPRFINTILSHRHTLKWLGFIDLLSTVPCERRTSNKTSPRMIIKRATVTLSAEPSFEGSVVIPMPLIVCPY